MRLPSLLPLLAGVALVTACSDGVTETPVGGPAFEAALTPVTPLRTPALTARTWSRSTPDGPVIDSITGLVRFVKALDGRARYRFYVVNGVDSTAIPVAHLQVLERTDSILDANGGVITQVRTTANGLRDYYVGGGYGQALRYRIALSSTDSLLQRSSWLVMTIQPDSANPRYDSTTSRPLWVQYRDQRGTQPRGDDTVFTADTLRGSFGTFRSPARREVFVARGGGRATLWDLFSTSGQAPIISFEATDLTRPPVGYRYTTYLHDERTGLWQTFGFPVDGAGQPLFDADTTRDSTVAVLRASFSPDTGQRAIREFTEAALLLEPKSVSLPPAGAVTVPGITAAVRGAFPAPITAQRPAAGTVRVLVTRSLQTGNPEPNIGVVILGAGADFNTLLGNRNTDVNGTASFTGVPTGRTRVLIVPPAGRTVVGQSEQFVTVPANAEVTVRFVVN
ncbi:MAG: hypothetical protein MUF40_03750 [Gemmatimonadaceae bacterium]|jgi:hypothetical protein|nr:hypothetical protein [Gemmatimonadaceae bacterium]